MAALHSALDVSRFGPPPSSSRQSQTGLQSACPRSPYFCPLGLTPQRIPGMDASREVAAHNSSALRAPPSHQRSVQASTLTSFSVSLSSAAANPLPSELSTAAGSLSAEAARPFGPGERASDPLSRFLARNASFCVWRSPCPPAGVSASSMPPGGASGDVRAPSLTSVLPIILASPLRRKKALRKTDAARQSFNDEAPESPLRSTAARARTASVPAAEASARRRAASAEPRIPSAGEAGPAASPGPRGLRDQGSPLASSRAAAHPAEQESRAHAAPQPASPAAPSLLFVSPSLFAGDATRAGDGKAGGSGADGEGHFSFFSSPSRAAGAVFSRELKPPVQQPAHGASPFSLLAPCPPSASPFASSLEAAPSAVAPPAFSAAATPMFLSPSPRSPFLRASAVAAADAGGGMQASGARRKSDFIEMAPNRWTWGVRLGERAWEAYRQQMALTSHFAVTSDEIARSLLQGQYPNKSALSRPEGARRKTYEGLHDEAPRLGEAEPRGRARSSEGRAGGSETRADARRGSSSEAEDLALARKLQELSSDDESLLSVDSRAGNFRSATPRLLLPAASQQRRARSVEEGGDEKATLFLDADLTSSEEEGERPSSQKPAIAEEDGRETAPAWRGGERRVADASQTHHARPDSSSANRAQDAGEAPTERAVRRHDVHLTMAPQLGAPVQPPLRDVVARTPIVLGAPHKTRSRPSVQMRLNREANAVYVSSQERQREMQQSRKLSARRIGEPDSPVSSSLSLRGAASSPARHASHPSAEAPLQEPASCLRPSRAPREELSLRREPLPRASRQSHGAQPAHAESRASASVSARFPPPPPLLGGGAEASLRERRASLQAEDSSLRRGGREDAQSEPAESEKEGGSGEGGAEAEVRGRRDSRRGAPPRAGLDRRRVKRGEGEAHASLSPSGARSGPSAPRRATDEGLFSASSEDSALVAPVSLPRRASDQSRLARLSFSEQQGRRSGDGSAEKARGRRSSVELPRGHRDQGAGDGRRASGGEVREDKKKGVGGAAELAGAEDRAPSEAERNWKESGKGGLAERDTLRRLEGSGEPAVSPAPAEELPANDRADYGRRREDDADETQSLSSETSLEDFLARSDPYGDSPASEEKRGRRASAGAAPAPPSAAPPPASLGTDASQATATEEGDGTSFSSPPDLFADAAGGFGHDDFLDAEPLGDQDARESGDGEEPLGAAASALALLSDALDRPAADAGGIEGEDASTPAHARGAASSAAAAPLSALSAALVEASATPPPAARTTTALAVQTDGLPAPPPPVVGSVQRGIQTSPASSPEGRRRSSREARARKGGEKSRGLTRATMPPRLPVVTIGARLVEEPISVLARHEDGGGGDEGEEVEGADGVVFVEGGASAASAESDREAPSAPPGSPVRSARSAQKRRYPLRQRLPALKSWLGEYARYGYSEDGKWGLVGVSRCVNQDALRAVARDVTVDGVLGAVAGKREEKKRQELMRNGTLLELAVDERQKLLQLGQHVRVSDSEGDEAAAPGERRDRRRHEKAKRKRREGKRGGTGDTKRRRRRQTAAGERAEPRERRERLNEDAEAAWRSEQGAEGGGDDADWGVGETHAEEDEPQAPERRRRRGGLPQESDSDEGGERAEETAKKRQEKRSERRKSGGRGFSEDETELPKSEGERRRGKRVIHDDDQEDNAQPTDLTSTTYEEGEDGTRRLFTYKAVTLPPEWTWMNANPQGTLQTALISRCGASSHSLLLRLAPGTTKPPIDSGSFLHYGVVSAGRGLHVKVGEKEATLDAEGMFFVPQHTVWSLVNTSRGESVEVYLTFWQMP
ncbi:hypothetical protein BESB_047110 [Besnoitia besnoiti]|uniref:Cupin domain-containing protein n=1 Tax=Besnoitia besnoiti TaxID=94643 RepID=A0A2A9MF47_BESBE|nr:hypothetical protein BESB_047110 [Besnoitia besnoiti]PFH36519.1 hypothetical protein BESB_047110 [Besnoitia besnoiti]